MESKEYKIKNLKPLPLGKGEGMGYFLPYQSSWINDTHQICILEKSRRTGGTDTTAYIAIEWALKTGMRKKDVWFSSADLTAAEEFIIYVKKWIKFFNAAAKDVGEIVVEDEEDSLKALRVILFNGARITALSSNSKGFRSKEGFIVLDEFAHHEDQLQLWKAALPCRLWGYPIRILSSHNGKGLFYSMCEDAKMGRVNWGHHRVDILEAVEHGLLDKIKGRPTDNEERQQWLKELKRDCNDEVIWNEEFLCIAANEGTAFLTYELIASCESNNTLFNTYSLPFQQTNEWNGINIIKAPDAVENKWIHQSIENFINRYNSIEINGELFLGVDIGRDKDLSVFWLDEKLGDIKYTRLIFELDRMPFWVQELILNALLQHKRMRRCCIDKTGIGKQLAENAELKFYPIVEGINFTNQIKEEMAYKLKASFEDKTLRVPSNPVIRADLHSVKKEITSAGNTRLAVTKETDENGKPIGHADRFWAKALANFAEDGKTYIPLKIKSGGARENIKLLEGYYI